MVRMNYFRLLLFVPILLVGCSSVPKPGSPIAKVQAIPLGKPIQIVLQMMGQPQGYEESGNYKVLKYCQDQFVADQMVYMAFKNDLYIAGLKARNGSGLCSSRFQAADFSALASGMFVLKPRSESSTYYNSGYSSSKGSTTYTPPVIQPPVFSDQATGRDEPSRAWDMLRGKSSGGSKAWDMLLDR